jgi:hypothetical protein
MNVFLSYGECDKLRNQRHTTTTDAPNGLGADEYPLLSLWVMKSTSPVSIPELDVMCPAPPWAACAAVQVGPHTLYPAATTGRPPPIGGVGTTRFCEPGAIAEALGRRCF